MVYVDVLKSNRCSNLEYILQIITVAATSRYVDVEYTGVNSYNAAIFLYKAWRTKGGFQF